MKTNTRNGQTGDLKGLRKEIEKKRITHFRNEGYSKKFTKANRFK